MTSAHARESRESRLFEPELRAAADGLALTVRVEQNSLRRSLYVTDRTGRAMEVGHAIRKWISQSNLRAILAAFAEGAAEIKWQDGTILEMLIEPEAKHNDTEGGL